MSCYADITEWRGIRSHTGNLWRRQRTVFWWRRLRQPSKIPSMLYEGTFIARWRYLHQIVPILRFISGFSIRSIVDRYEQKRQSWLGSCMMLRNIELSPNERWIFPCISLFFPFLSPFSVTRKGKQAWVRYGWDYLSTSLPYSFQLSNPLSKL